jgi:hypothetical protein
LILSVVGSGRIRILEPLNERLVPIHAALRQGFCRRLLRLRRRGRGLDEILDVDPRAAQGLGSRIIVGNERHPSEGAAEAPAAAFVIYRDPGSVLLSP